IAGLASVMRRKSLHVELDVPAIDIVGTGGDGSGSFNISTAAAFVAAGAGLHVAKHGNRAASSRCGSADVLEALGVKIDLSPEGVKRCVEEAGIGFMFAPVYHPAMKHVAPTRREIGIRTVFNILGPLTNPARAVSLVLGVPSEDIGNKMAAVLQRLGTEHSLVVHGCDGLDEVSPSGRTIIWDVQPGNVAPPYEVTPADFGYEAVPASALTGGTPDVNADALRVVLAGKACALRNAVIMNGAAALMAAGITNDTLQAAAKAAEAIDSGKAIQKLDKLVELSNRLE
ncbi:MAG: anthranilate phosphoribosyltransferase, partial [Dehalococcoidales bacterium]|nr:anthranilate phosphoribosyltransferase [Dehalococcoidales bacterium]